MRIILPGLEGMEYTRYALQQYTDRVANQVGAPTPVVSDRHSRALFKIIVEDALAMGMTASAARMMCRYTETEYERFLDEFFSSIGVQVTFEDVYLDVLDELVLAQWHVMEPYLSGIVPFNVDVTWLGTNILVYSNIRGPHHPPRRKRKPIALDATFDAANKASHRERPSVLTPPSLLMQRTRPTTALVLSSRIPGHGDDQEYPEGHFDTLIDELLSHHGTNQ